MNIFPYQQQGIAWLSERIRIGGGLLTDDMGLGKTLQLLRAAQEADERPTFVICPSSLVGVWESEARRWTSMPVRRWADVKCIGYGLTIASYPQLLKDAKAMQLALPRNALLIADEAHRLKNAKSKGSVAFGALSFGAYVQPFFNLGASHQWLVVGQSAHGLAEHLVLLAGPVQVEVLVHRCSSGVVAARTGVIVRTAASITAPTVTRAGSTP